MLGASVIADDRWKHPDIRGRFGRAEIRDWDQGSFQGSFIVSLGCREKPFFVR
jgi:hypothetical protein